KVRPNASSRCAFWRDRTREVDFVADMGGRIELYEAKWTELPTPSDTVNLEYFGASSAGVASLAESFVVLETVTRSITICALWPSRISPITVNENRGSVRDSNPAAFCRGFRERTGRRRGRGYRSC